jgi:fatty-acyl-CoA synthase
MAEQLAIPEFPTIVDALEYRARVTPDQRAFVIEGEETTYGELWQDALRAAHGLSANGIGPGDRCAVVLPSSIDFLRLLFGLQIRRAVPMPMNRRLPATLIARRLDRFRAVTAICPGDATSAIGAACAERDLTLRPLSLTALLETDPAGPPIESLPGNRDIAYIQITSGTTGEPKGAVVPHESLAACIRGCADRQQTFADDVYVGWVPLYHDMGLVRFACLPIYVGAPAYILEPSVANFSRWLELISEVGGTVSAAPDFGYRIASRMVDPARVDLSSLRLSVNGGEPPRISTIENFERRYNIPGVLRPGYGLSEATLTVAMAPSGDPLRVDESGSVANGPAVLGAEIRICDDAGRPVAPGERGEINVRGKLVFAGYLDDPQATDEVLSPDGWLRTGDIGYLDGDGYLYILGRRRAMIKHGGASIPPREIEEVVDLVPGIRFSAVVGVCEDSAQSSENPVVVAEIRSADGADGLAMGELCRTISLKVEDTIGFVPADVLLVEPRTIHRTATGKIQHWRLRQAIENGELRDAGKIVYRFAEHRLA